MLKLEWLARLFNDDSVREKLKVMSKWDVINDDSRNVTPDVSTQVEDFLVLGKTYKISITIEEV